MKILKNILIVVYLIVCVALILITTFQVSDNEKPIDDAYENSRTNKYFEKNKGRTKAGRIQKRTIIVGVLFGILTIVTTLVCYLAY